MEIEEKKGSAQQTEPGTEESAADFTEHMQTVLRGGYISMAISVGLETGLLQALCGLHEPKSVQEIADLTGMKERLVFVCFLFLS